jgi:murein DD-endopeptidase MepM/ murein hydrolase activator NlpD
MKWLLAVVAVLGAALVPSAAASAKPASGPSVAGTSNAAAASLPLPRSAASRGDYAQPHWNSTPAVDLIVPSGTPVYATLATTTQHLDTDSCGVGLRLNFGNGDRFVYCHLTSRSVGSGVPVAAGQLVGYSGDTGNSGAPHLHVEIRTGDGAIRCPQPLLLAIYDGAAPPPLSSLPTSGCTG